jgi:hypothetical protein
LRSGRDRPYLEAADVLDADQTSQIADLRSITDIDTDRDRFTDARKPDGYRRLRIAPRNSDD